MLDYNYVGVCQICGGKVYSTEKLCSKCFPKEAIKEVVKDE